MRIFNSHRTTPAIIKDEPPSYKSSDAAVFTYRFITSIKGIRNAAVLKSDHTMALYINTEHTARMLLKSINDNDERMSMKYLNDLRGFSSNLFANTNVSLLHKHIYYSREIFRNIEVILNND